MRALLLAGAMALLLVLAPPAAGAGRLDGLAQHLRERPLAIDSELAWFFDAADERRLVRTLRRSPVDVHVALVPQFEDDESGGDGYRIIASLHRRLRHPGVYVVIDQHGYFDVGSYAVPRQVSFPFDLKVPATGDGLKAGAVVARMQRLVADLAAAPRAQATDEPDPRPLQPYENWRLRRYGETTGEVALDAAVAGGILGLFAGGVARLVARRDRARADRLPPRRGRRRRR
jgi:hypothetical protein